MSSQLLRPLAALALAATCLLSQGCADSCNQLCSQAGAFYDSCLEEFGQDWGSAGIEGVASRSDFVSSCRDEAVAAIAAEKELMCTEVDDVEGCEANIDLSIARNCEDRKENFRVSCSEGVLDLLDYTPINDPETFVLEPGDGDDDDDSAAGDDDDDSAE